jgi:hypothetical protein
MSSRSVIKVCICWAGIRVPDLRVVQDLQKAADLL